MWHLSEPWYALIFRAIIIYIFLLVMLRLSGKRHVGQLAPFDFVLLLIISNTVQNAMNAGDNSLSAGLLLAFTVMVLNQAVTYLTWRFRKVEIFIEGEPQVLIHNGVANQQLMRRERLTQHDLMMSLRQHGLTRLEDVQTAILENNGSVSICARASDDGSQEAHKQSL